MGQNLSTWFMEAPEEQYNLEKQIFKILQNMPCINYMYFVYLATMLIIRKIQMLEMHSLSFHLFFTETLIGTICW